MPQLAHFDCAWLKLASRRYHDGYQAQALDQPDIAMVTMFYPKYWLDATGYWLNKPNLGPGVLLFDANPEAGAATTSSTLAAVVVTAIVSSLCTALIGGYLLRGKLQLQQRHQYTPIDL